MEKTDFQISSVQLESASFRPRNVGSRSKNRGIEWDPGLLRVLLSIVGRDRPIL